MFSFVEYQDLNGADLHDADLCHASLAGAFVLMDEIFGVSSNWMRYMTAVMALKRHQAEFEMEWAKLTLELKGEPPSPDQQAKTLDLLTDFRLKVVGEMENEIHTWVAEFKSNLARLEQQAKSRLQPAAGKGSGKS